MHRWKRIFTVGASTAVIAALLGLGNLLFRDVQFARAQQQVDSARQQLATLNDYTTALKSVARAVQPSVVEIKATKTLKRTSMPDGSDNPVWQRFFREFGGEGLNMPPEMFEGQQPMRQIGTGSGVIMEVSGDTGYILTNNHVASDASLAIKLSDGRIIKEAKLVGADAKTDLAVVEIKADKLIAAKWGDSTTLEQGDMIVAFGSPFGYVGSMSHGIVSALNRRAGILGDYGYENFIQVDAPINPGNSGGPLVNLNGEVVGINTAIASSSGGFQGIGFAIPSEQAKTIYGELRSSGKIVRGWLGLGITSVADASDQAKSTGYTGSTGVFVLQVMNESPATDKLQPGDVITSLNGKDLKDSEVFRKIVAKTTPGTEVSMGVVREGKEQTVKVKLGQQPDSAEVLASRNAENPMQNSTTQLGLRLGDLNGELAQRFGFDTGKTGAVVLQVRPGSLAAQAGLEPGDVITRVNNQDVSDSKQAAKALAQVDVKKGIRLKIENRQGSEMVFLQPGGQG